MAIYHCSIKIGSRSKGQSAVAAAAYRSGEKLTDQETGLVSDYTRKGGVVFSEISLCENAPAKYADRATLWNAVHEIEKAKDARLWREIEVALPQEMNRAEQIEAVREYVRGLTERGMCADWSLHDKGDGNPHAHIMLTTRSIIEDGKWAPKSRKVYDLDETGERIFQKVDKTGRKQYKSHKEDYNDWNATERVEEWRAEWANVCNKYLQAEKKIDHRSYERQGLELIPTVHEGYVARLVEAKGGTSELCQKNREIKAKNSILRGIIEDLKIIGNQIKQLMEQKGSDISDRFGKLFAARAATKSERGTADGERAAASRPPTEGRTDTAAVIRAARSNIADSRARAENSGADRAEREAARERQRAAAIEAARQAEQRAREERKRQDKGMER